MINCYTTIIALILLYCGISSYSFAIPSPTIATATDHISAPILSRDNPIPPIVYTIAGSDSGGGAGIQADLHAIHAFGCHGCSAITCLTAQNSVGVTAVHFPPVSFLAEQLQTLLSDLPPAAIKIGMLGNREIAVQIGKFLEQVKKESERKVWVVLDPVMISTSGHRLIQEDAQEAMIEHVFPYVDILTPNKFEAEALLRRKLESVTDIEEGASDLLAMGVPTVIIKGGHSLDSGPEARWAQDYIVSSGEMPEEPRLCDCLQRGVWIRTPRFDSKNTHGTGCTLSSAMASALALGANERLKEKWRSRGALSSIQAIDAFCLAKAYVTEGIARGVQLGSGPGPVAHTSFPSSHHYFPTISGDPTKDPSSFLQMEFPETNGLAVDYDSRSKLGRIMPVVDSVDWVTRLCRIDGITDIQLRIKDEKDKDRIAKMVRSCQDLCKDAGVRLWVNDFWEAAIDGGCFGVHLGQEDLYACAQAAGLDALKKNKIALGISTHSFGELAAALGIKPTYISLGPVFATDSKDVSFDQQGPETVANWRQLIPTSIPLVVIGGIGEVESVIKVRQSGADCAAVIGAITRADNIEKVVSAFNQAMS